MEIMDYIVKEMLVLIPLLYIIGMIVKATPKVANWFIPYIIIVLGVVFAIGIGGFNMDSVIQGILVAGTTVLADQVIKQTVNR